jgi:hypothetical protein
MRRFFRFSIRDLLWLTLVIAIGLAWFLREREFEAKVEQAGERATVWREVAAGLEQLLRKKYGWVVQRDWSRGSASASVSEDGGIITISCRSRDPVE